MKRRVYGKGTGDLSNPQMGELVPSEFAPCSPAFANAAQVDNEFLQTLRRVIDFQENQFHPLVWVRGKPKIGKNVYIGMMSIINCKYCEMVIGDNCDIGPLVSINCADSHERSLGLMDKINRKPIKLGKNVFVGCNAVILGGTEIGHHSVVGAGTVVRPSKIPPYSLVFGNPMIVKPGYYKNKIKK